MPNGTVEQDEGWFLYVALSTWFLTSWVHGAELSLKRKEEAAALKAEKEKAKADAVARKKQSTADKPKPKSWEAFKAEKGIIDPTDKEWHDLALGGPDLLNKRIGDVKEYIAWNNETEQSPNMAKSQMKPSTPFTDVVYKTVSFLYSI